MRRKKQIMDINSIYFVTLFDLVPIKNVNIRFVDFVGIIFVKKQMDYVLLVEDLIVTKFNLLLSLQKS